MTTKGIPDHTMTVDRKLSGLNGRTLVLLFTILLAVGLGSGCSVYFNTFFNCKKAFNRAESTRKNTPVSSRTQGRAAGAQYYNVAIEKAQKVVESFPNSKYYDDALYILGVSYFHTGQFSRSERRLRELIANYDDSEYLRECNLYLAKAKLALGDVEDAKVLFEDIFQQDYDRSFKAEAAEALGSYHFERQEYSLSRDYFLAIRDSLGEDDQPKNAQRYLADGYYESFQFGEALGGYLQMLGMDPDRNQKYHALYRSAICSYRLQRIDDGLEYLNQLIEEEEYYDSLGVLQLTVAEGLEYEDDLTGAEAVYEEVAQTSERLAWQARAYYRLGLIYQFDYDDLEGAKAYYDDAIRLFGSRGSTEEAKDALQRSTDIGKLETFARTPLDSGATEEMIDEAAYNQYKLGELYWFSLNKPDSGLLEMRYLVDSFPTSYHAPKGLIVLSQMYRDHLEDTTGADSLLKLAVTRYPSSDYVPEALELLGLKGTAADTGYAEVYMHRAENFLVDDDNVDSARANYRIVVERFEDSEHYLQARFNLIWIEEEYGQTGDSTVYYAYEAFADTFAESDLARVARSRIGAARAAPERDRDDDRARDEEDTEGDDSEDDTKVFADTGSGYIDPLLALYYTPAGDTLVDLELEPIETEIEFEFPAEASTPRDQNIFELYFWILVDFAGEVIDYELRIPSGIDLIDERAEETVESMTFDALDVSNALVEAGRLENTSDDGNWFVYKYVVEKPEYLR